MKSLETAKGASPNRIAFVVDIDRNKPFVHPPGATLRSDRDIEVCFSIIQNGRESQLGCLLLRREKHHDSYWLRSHIQMIKPEYLPNRQRRDIHK
jgi:hypothetical protein